MMEHIVPLQDGGAAIYREAPTRADIARLEQAMRAMPQIEIQTEHTFGPGFYARTIHLPAGTTLTGKVHATEHIFVLSKGELVVATEDGVKTIQAPFQMVCRPGLKRAGHAITDVVCTNIHITQERDLARLEAELIETELIEGPQKEEVLPWHG